MKNPEIKAKVVAKQREAVAAGTHNFCEDRHPMKNSEIKAKQLASMRAARAIKQSRMAQNGLDLGDCED